MEGQDLRHPAEHQRPAALVPQGPRPHAARDVGRDDRDGQEASGRARATSSSRATSTRATSCGSTTSSPPRAERSSTPRAEPTLDEPARQGRADHQGRRDLRPRRRVAVDRRRRTRRGSPSRPARAPSCSTGRTSTPPRATPPRRNPTTKKVFENMGYARWPGRQQGRAEQGLDRRRQPRRPEHRPEPGARDRGRAVHDERQVAGAGGHQRGPSARHELDLRRPRRSARSTRSPTCCASSCKDSVVRPATPSYSDVTLAIQDVAAPAGERSTRRGDQHARVTA